MNVNYMNADELKMNPEELMTEKASVLTPFGQDYTEAVKAIWRLLDGCRVDHAKWILQEAINGLDSLSKVRTKQP